MANRDRTGGDLDAALARIDGLSLPFLEGRVTPTPAALPVALADLIGILTTQGKKDAVETARSMVSFLHGLPVEGASARDRRQLKLLFDNLREQLLPLRSPENTRPALGVGLVPPVAPSMSGHNDRVALFIDSAAVAAMLTEVLEQNDFAPYRLESMQSLAETPDDALPAAIVADLSLCRDDPDTHRVVSALRQRTSYAPHLFCLAGGDDFTARLEAVRLGATRFLKKPLDTGRLVAVLRGVTERAPTEPFRVLVVDDDRALTSLYSTTLAEVGIVVQATNDPLAVPALIADFRPDVVVSDVFMPGCNGLELAAVLRQDDGLAAMPIIFLSSETSIWRQLAALDLGADDFLTKPVNLDVLQAAVLARAKRARWLKRTHREYHRVVRQFDTLLESLKDDGPREVWRFDSVRRTLYTPNARGVDLTAMEARLVGYLFTQPERRASREQLFAAMSGGEAYDAGRLEATVSRLRRKLADKGGWKLPLVPEYGQGYAFTGASLLL